MHLWWLLEGFQAMPAIGANMEPNQFLHTAADCVSYVKTCVPEQWVMYIKLLSISTKMADWMLMCSVCGWLHVQRHENGLGSGNYPIGRSWPHHVYDAQVGEKPQILLASTQLRCMPLCSLRAAFIAAEIASCLQRQEQGEHSSAFPLCRLNLARLNSDLASAYGSPGELLLLRVPVTPAVPSLREFACKLEAWIQTWPTHVPNQTFTFKSILDSYENTCK